MAITRCPYCHAIIDEADKYCNNCGTQLLFTEDEAVEEEIPGEKIIDAEVEEKDYTVDEPESEKRHRPAPAKDLEAEIGDELEDDLPEGTAKTAIEELMAGADLENEEAELEGDEEVILVDEIKASEADDKAPEPEAPAAVKPADRGEEEHEPELGSEDELLEEEIEEDEDLEDEELEAEEKAEAAEEEEEKIKSGDDEEAEDEELADELKEDLEDEIEEEPVKGPEAAAARLGEDETREYGRPAVPSASAGPEPGPEKGASEPQINPPDGPGPGYIESPDVPNEAATAGEASLRPATFDSQELENLGRTVELSRAKIDKFIEVIAAKTSDTAAGADASEPEPEPAPEVVEREAIEPEPASKAAGPDLEPEPGRTPEPPTGTLPPWASMMKGAPVFPEDAAAAGPAKVKGGPVATDTDEVEIFPRRRGSDSTIGLPEKIAQAPLPFEGPDDEEELEAAEAEEREAMEADEDRPGPVEAVEEAAEPSGGPTPAPEIPLQAPRETVLPPRDLGAGRLAAAEVPPAAEPEEAAPRQPFSLAVFFKSKVFDLLFIGLFWLVALWLAASSTGVTLFDILGAMSTSMLLLYVAFVLLYFFLFKFFLGETLGDRLFRPRERE